MPKKVNAKPGETFCNIAAGCGFLNCDPLRILPENQRLLADNTVFDDGAFIKEAAVTVPDLEIKEEKKASENRWRFQLVTSPPVSIRYVHGSPDKPYREDFTTAILNVSNIRTNRGGANGNVAFPAGTRFDQAGHADIDAFKIEIVDPGAGGTVRSMLQAMKPAIRPDGTVDPGRHEPFAGAELARRRNEITLRQVPSNVCFRSPYLRLVVDDADKASVAAQTLLTTDMADGAEGDDDKVEILDQLVKASYENSRCAQAPKCKVSTAAPIGSARLKVRVAVHILQGITGAPVTPVQVRRRVLNYVRQLYAQADMTVKILEPIRSVPLPANMLAIANGAGRRARGGGLIRVRIRIDDLAGVLPAVDVEAAITTVANDLPIATANALAAAISAVVPGGTKVAASENPPLVGQVIGSADVIVGDPLTQRIRLNILDNGDVRHPVRICQLTSARVTDFGGDDSHVGTRDERVLVKNYDTGRDRVDLFVVQALTSTALGEAFTSNFARAANRQPVDSMANSAIVFADTIRINDHFHTTIPHELGHILMDANHAIPATEMMGNGSPVGANERVPHGPKRISDPRRVSYDNGITDVPVTLLRTANAALLE